MIFVVLLSEQPDGWVAPEAGNNRDCSINGSAALPSTCPTECSAPLAGPPATPPTVSRCQLMSVATLSD